MYPISSSLCSYQFYLQRPVAPPELPASFPSTKVQIFIQQLRLKYLQLPKKRKIELNHEVYSLQITDYVMAAYMLCWSNSPIQRSNTTRKGFDNFH